MAIQNSGGRNAPKRTTPDQAEQGGSWWSHAAYGIGALALVAPLFIPGIPFLPLFIAYCAVALAALIGLMLWGVVYEGLQAWAGRRRKKGIR